MEVLSILLVRHAEQDQLQLVELSQICLLDAFNVHLDHTQLVIQ